MAESRDPLVFLVGAGPGNPGLLTLRAVECLAAADLVVYDQLVPVGFLEHAPATAKRMCVTELANRHVERVSLVQEAIIAAARAGKRVVRLKGGDPFIFGRGGEEAEALREAGIAYEVVPGITAGLAAAAYAGIPLTHRAHTSAVALVTGHEDPDKPESALDWSVLARFPGTLVVYMGVSHLPQIVRALLENGKKADTPAAVIQLATTGYQRTVEAPLHGLAKAVKTAGLTSPAIVLIGPVVKFRSRLAWSENRPLIGKRVLVTRPRHQARDLVHRLEELGAIPFLLPVVNIAEPPDWSKVDQALAELGRFDWLVFTSINGVHALVKRLGQTGRDLRALGHLKLAAIGPGTAEALRGYFLEPDLVPSQFNSESLAADLKTRVAGGRVLLARADRGRDVLRQELAAVAKVEQVAVYSQVDSPQGDPEILEVIHRGAMDYVTLTSSNIARSLARMLDEPSRAHLQSGQVKVVSISPVTSEVIRELGWPVAAEAAEATMAGIVQALVDLAVTECRIK